MVALVHTWTQSLNQDSGVSTSSYYNFCSAGIFKWIQFLKANGWTFVAGSGKNGGGSVVYSAAADPILTSADLAWNSSAAARSWWLGKSPEGIVAGANGSYTGDQSRVWLCIDCEGGGSIEYYLRLRLHRVAPSGTASTTTVPTSTDVRDTGMAQWIDTAGLSLAGTSVKFHFAITDGEVIGGVTKSVGGFYFLTSRVGAGYLASRIVLTPATGVQQIGALDYPYAIALKMDYAASSAKFTYTDLNAALGWNHDGTGIAAGWSVRVLSDSAGGCVGKNVSSAGNLNGGIPNSEIFFCNDTSGKVMSPAFKLADHRATGAVLNVNTAGEVGTVYHYWVGGTTTGAIAIPASNALTM